MTAGVQGASGPRLDLLAAAAVRESFRPAELLDRWLKEHEGAPERLVDEAVDATLDFKEIGIETPGPDGSPALKLGLRERREILGRLGTVRAREETAAITAATRTATESALLSLLRPDGAEPDPQDRDQLMAWRAAVSWGSSLGVASKLAPGEIDRQIDRLDYLRLIGGPDLRRFVGRSRELEELTGLWQVPGSRTVLVEGPGGIGKSLLVSRFIADLLQPGPADGAPDAVFHIDFDRPDLQRGGWSDIFAELVRQSERWVGENALPELRDIRAELGAPGGLESASRRSRGSRRGQDSGDVAERLVRLIGRHPDRRPTRHRPRIVLFADTLERVIGFSDYAVDGIVDARNALRSAGARVFAILASRTFEPAGQPLDADRRITLAQLPRPDALRYLTTEAARAGVTIGVQEAGAVVDAVQGSPLALRLAVSLLEKEGAGANPRAWVDGVGVSSDRIQATLYDRILLRIRDDDLRRIALPGLLVRRLTAEVVGRVLAEPCGLGGTNPGHLMRLAEREGQLFQRIPTDPDALWHRQDVRSLMLPDLDRCIAPATARDVNARAIRHYEASADTVSRTEELYHRLRMDQDPRTLDERWEEEAGERLRSIIDEFPPGAQSYLRQRLGGASAASFAGVERRLEASDSRVQDVRGVAERMLQSDAKATEVWDLLRSQGLDELGGPLGDVVADLLVAERKFDALIAGARDIPSHPLGADATIRAEILCTAAGALEGLGRVREARNVWSRAVAIEAAGHVALGGAVGLHRTGRKMGVPATAGPLVPSAAVASMLRALGRGLLKLPVLAREATAEFGGWRELVADNQRLFRDLTRMLLETGEAFPSALQDSRRTADIGMRLVRRPTQHIRELQSIASKQLDDVRSPEFATFVELLREEVEWSIARAVRKPAP